MTARPYVSSKCHDGSRMDENLAKMMAELERQQQERLAKKPEPKRGFISPAARRMKTRSMSVDTGLRLERKPNPRPVDEEEEEYSYYQEEEEEEEEGQKQRDDDPTESPSPSPET